MARQESGLDTRCLEGGYLGLGRAWSQGKKRTDSRWDREANWPQEGCHGELMTNKVERLLNL